MTWLLLVGRFLLANWKLIALASAASAVFGYVLHCESVKRDRGRIIDRLQVQAEEQDKRNKLQVARELKAKEAADAKSKSDIAALQRTIERLRNDRQRAPSLPPAPATSTKPELACFSRADLARAVGVFEAGMEGLLAECAAAAVELDAARQWAQGL